MVDSDLIFTMAEAIKSAIEEEFDDAGTDLPERRFVANGSVAFDCEQLAVQLERVRSGLTATGDGGPINCVVVRTIEFALWLTRCVPTMVDDGTPPTVEELEASAEILLTDALLLSEAVHRRRGDYAGKRDVSYGELTPLPISGGHGGFVQRLRVQL